MTAPPIPRQLAGASARAWPAWEHIWDALDDGEWHRGADLAEQVMRDGIADVERTYLLMIVAKAWRAGLLEREERRAAAFARDSAAGIRVRRSGSDPWYRRPAGAS